MHFTFINTETNLPYVININVILRAFVGVDRGQVRLLDEQHLIRFHWLPETASKYCQLVQEACGFPD